MFISAVIKELGDVAYEATNEKEVAALGLCDYGPTEKYCSFAGQSKYLENIRPEAAVVITNSELSAQVLALGRGAIVVDNPKQVFFRVHDALCNQDFYCNPIYDTQIGERCHISKNAIICAQNVTIGNDVTIDDNVIIKDNVVIKDRAVIRAGSIIGGQNYQLYHYAGKVRCATHVGKVIIEEDADIGYNVTIGKGLYPWDSTVVGQNTVIADLVALGHGSKIGKRSFVCVDAVINGRASIGDDVWIGPKANISNGITVGNKGYVSLGSVVIKDVKEGQKVFGNPARAMFIE